MAWPGRFILCLVAGLILAADPSAQHRASDGVIIDEQGLPHYSTFSLCAVDPASGQSGAAVTTRVPFVGRAVPHVRAGVGAVCTQASTVVEYGPRGLDLLAKDVEPPPSSGNCSPTMHSANRGRWASST